MHIILQACTFHVVEGSTPRNRKEKYLLLLLVRLSNTAALSQLQGSPLCRRSNQLPWLLELTALKPADQIPILSKIRPETARQCQVCQSLSLASDAPIPSPDQAEAHWILSWDEVGPSAKAARLRAWFLTHDWHGCPDDYTRGIESQDHAHHKL